MSAFVVLMLLGTFALGYNDVLRKRYLTQGADEQLLLALTMLVAGVLLMGVVLVLGMPQLSSGFWTYFLSTLALNVVSQNLFIRAFKLSDVSTIAPLRLIIPPLVIGTGFMFLDEVPDLQGVLGICTTVVGLWVLLFSGRQYRLSLLRDRGVQLGLAGAVLFAISFPLDKHAVLLSSGLFFSGMISLCIGLCTYAVLAAQTRSMMRSTIRELSQRPGAYALLSLSWAAGNFLTNEALTYALAAYASSFKRLQALWTVVLSGRMLGEQGIAPKLIATGIMLLGVALTVL